MATVNLRFYAELRDCLAASGNGQGSGGFDHSFSGQVSVKDMMESLSIGRGRITTGCRVFWKRCWRAPGGAGLLKARRPIVE